MLGLSFLKGDKAMSEKRRDNRNRILHEGEYQRADGRYRFRYVDIHGNEGNLYSWRLDNNDPIPKGKKMELSLREKEKQLEQDMFNGLVPGGGGLTVLELVNVIVNDSVRREAVTRKQEREFLRFIKEDAHFCKYYDAIFILFNTGLRISEFCGLTKSDLDFKNKRIRVNHQLQRTSQMQYIIEKPKTESGERYVPMSDEVVACFKRILKDRVNPKVEPMVDGMTGFLFLDKNDMPMVALHWEKYFQHIREKYNSIYKVQMPPITPHVCRHTFCSNMAKSGMNPKMLQYIMGHSDISVTMNTYTHVKFQDAQEDFQKAINS